MVSSQLGYWGDFKEWGVVPFCLPPDILGFGFKGFWTVATLTLQAVRGFRIGES